MTSVLATMLADTLEVTSPAAIGTLVTMSASGLDLLTATAAEVIPPASQGRGDAR